MSTRRRAARTNEQGSSRNKTPVLSIAFALAMAFFLVIGMIAVALPEFIGGGSDQPETDSAPVTMQEEGEGEEAELRQRLEEDPGDYSAKSQLAVLLSNSGRLDESIQIYEDALEQRPDDVSLRLSFARALDRQSYTLDATVQLERVLEEDAANVEAMYLLAEIKAQGDSAENEDATQLYEQIVETEPDSYYAEMARDRLEGGGEESVDEGEASEPDEDQP